MNDKWTNITNEVYKSEYEQIAVTQVGSSNPYDGSSIATLDRNTDALAEVE